MSTRTELHITAAAAVAFAIFGAALAWGASGRGDTFLLMIFSAGALGATVHNFRHLAGDDGDETIVPAPTPARIYGSPIVGGVLGFSMYALCVSGLLGGKLFPTFHGSEAAFTSVQDFVRGQGPATNLDAAKALIWAFIAGWYRGALPNLLGGLLNRGGGRDGRSSAQGKSVSNADER